MSKTNNNNYSEIEEIREDLHSLRDNVVELTKHLQKDTLDQASEVGTIAKARVEDLKTRGQQEIKKIEKQVRAKPAQGLAIAFATGVVASMLLRGRR